MTIHSSSTSSAAELRFSGSHCRIFRMNRRKSSRSVSSPASLSVVSLCSSGDDSGRGIPAQKSPSFSDALARRSDTIPFVECRNPDHTYVRTQLTGSGEELVFPVRSSKKTQRGRPEEGYDFREVRSASVRVPFRIRGGRRRRHPTPVESLIQVSAHPLCARIPASDKNCETYHRAYVPYVDAISPRNV